MSISSFVRKSGCRQQVNLGTLTYTIHKRIFKRTNLERIGLRDSSGAALPEMGLNQRFQAGLDKRYAAEPGSGRFTDQVH
jgi:hypothetical protein